MSERLIHPGDNLSIVDVGVVDITSSDIECILQVGWRLAVELEMYEASVGVVRLTLKTRRLSAGEVLMS